MRYRLSTLLILTGVLPPVIAFLWLFGWIIPALIMGTATRDFWFSLASRAEMIAFGLLVVALIVTGSVRWRFRGE